VASRTSPPDVLLVNLPRTRHDLSVPLGLLSLAACLDPAARRAAILDFDLLLKLDSFPSDGTFVEKAVDTAASTGAKIFGITGDCANYPLVVSFASSLKDEIPAATVILGGPHASLIARETLEAFPAVDIVVIGEGEDTFPELMEALLLGRPFAGVRGIAYRRDGAVVFTEPRPLKDRLDDLPLPSFEAYPTREYLALFPARGVGPCLPVEAGRGCPRGCTFCSTSVMWRRTCRCKTPTRVLRELSSLEREYGVTCFELLHDNLAFDNSFLTSLCTLLTERSPGYVWTCSVSTDRLSPDLLRLMARAGCSGVLLGIETGSPRMQKTIGKNLDLEHADEVRALCVEAGIAISAAFMVGFPEETEDDLALTLTKALDWALHGSEIRLAQLAPLPGTATHRSQARHLVLGHTPPSGCTPFVEAPRQRELLARHPDVFSSFYTVPTKHPLGLELPRLVAFFDVMLNHYPQAFSQLLLCDITHAGGPLELFRRWSQWWDRTRPSEPVTRNGVFFTFHEFIDRLAESPAATPAD